MAREIPEVVRAAAGLAATVLDEARKLPETLPSLPVRIIGLAMQHAMKVQQQYAGLVARGDELFTGIRGEDEPGLATFDDDEPATPPGFRDSAFDRAAGTTTADAATYPITDAEVDEVPADPAADALADAAVEELAEQAGEAQTSLDDLAEGAPATDGILDELAIDEMLGDAQHAGAPDAGATPTPATEPAAEIPTTVDVLTPDGGVATVAATVTDEGVAAPEGAPAGDGKGSSGPPPPHAAGTAPIDGYDSFSIAQLRGRLRGYALSTVQELVAYENATRAREPYLRMLRNRLEKLEEQAIASSPLAPRGA